MCPIGVWAWHLRDLNRKNSNASVLLLDKTLYGTFLFIASVKYLLLSVEMGLGGICLVIFWCLGIF